MAKKIVRLTESQLHNIISESVSQILNEIGDTAAGQYMLNRASARRLNMDGSANYKKHKEIERYKDNAYNKMPWQARNAFDKYGNDAGSEEQTDYMDALADGDAEKAQNMKNVMQNQMHSLRTKYNPQSPEYYNRR